MAADQLVDEQRVTSRVRWADLPSGDLMAPEMEEPRHRRSAGVLSAAGREGGRLAGGGKPQSCYLDVGPRVPFQRSTA